MRRKLMTLTLIGGIVVAAGSLIMAAGLTALMIWGRDALGGQGLMLGVLALSLATVVPALGLLAAWHAGRGLADKSAAPFRLPAWGWLLSALIVVLAGGQALFNLGAELAVALSHILAAILASLLVLTIPVGAARRQGWAISRRAGVGGLAWGALGGVGLAVMFEAILMAGIVIAGILILSAINPAWVEDAAGILQGAGDAGEAALDALSPLLSSPLLLLGGLLLAAALIPAIEEFVKSLAVPLVHASGRSQTRLDAFLLGAAAGAGFALLEGITNGAMALIQPSGWAIAMTTRSGVAVIHVLASALAGLAWQTGLVQRRWGKALALFTAAVLLHGIWNGGAVLVAWLGLRASSQAPNTIAIWGNLLIPVIVALMGAGLLGSLVLLAVLPGRLARVAPPPAETALVETNA
jgi:hypothetical protein